MNFDIYGPYDLPRTRAGLTDNSSVAKNAFWSGIESEEKGLIGVCGVYVYCVQARRGSLPWYVGITEKRPFTQEALADRQAKLYDLALETSDGRIKNGVKPQLFFLPLHTKGEWRFAKPSKNGRPAVRFLEKYIIGLALDRNPSLLNQRETRFLKGMHVPGLLNTAQGSLSDRAKALCSVLKV